MLCLSPITVRKGDPTEAVVPCGKCYECMSNKRNEWSLRLKSEFLSSFGGLFLTLTYSDDNLPIGEFVNDKTGEVIIKPFPSKRSIQLFMKRLRKKYGNNSFRYFAVSEYGGQTKRPHWHMLLFFQREFVLDSIFYDGIVHCWSLGFVQFGSIEDASIHYVTKYVLKESEYLLGYNDTCILTSRKPALGYKVLMDQIYKENLPKLNLSSISLKGRSGRLPRLYREKIRTQIDPELYEQISFNMQVASDEQLQRQFRKSGMSSFQEFMEFRRAASLRLSDILKSHHKKDSL